MGNGVARRVLEELFGAECFIKKLHLRKDNKNYTGIGQKKKMKKLKNKNKLTYHHIIEEHHNGKATIENGAILSVENHQWFHEQPLSDQLRMDRKFQDYKMQALKDKGIDLCIFEDGFDVPSKDLYTKEDLREISARMKSAKKREEKRAKKEKRQERVMKQEERRENAKRDFLKSIHCDVDISELKIGQRFGSIDSETKSQNYQDNHSNYYMNKRKFEMEK